jgi:hypothetical protein
MGGMGGGRSEEVGRKWGPEDRLRVDNKAFTKVLILRRRVAPREVSALAP